jgi:hypothetical protein
MKKLVIFLSLILAVTFTYAQDEYQNDEIQTIFSKRKSNGAYGAFSVGYSEIGGRDALVSGGRGAFIFDHSLAIGLGGYGFVNNLDYHSSGNNEFEYSLAGGYGGIFIEPIIAGRSPVHLSFPILIGMGGVSLFENYGWDYWDQHHPTSSFGTDVFFVVEPAVELEFNLARFFRVAATASYRHTSKIELLDTSADALRGFNFGMVFKFGKF